MEALGGGGGSYELGTPVPAPAARFDARGGGGRRGGAGGACQARALRERECERDREPLPERTADALSGALCCPLRSQVPSAVLPGSLISTFLDALP